tara:strand:- start:5064 stop:5240 length:177 start_codon:yes stop_codon:yes gene_type:complete
MKLQTKEIKLSGDNMGRQDVNIMGEIINEALTELGIPVTSFSWNINVEYLPEENREES